MAGPATRQIYLDYASTPIAPEVGALMREAMGGPFGHPSRPYQAGCAGPAVAASGFPKSDWAP